MAAPMLYSRGGRGCLGLWRTLRPCWGNNSGSSRVRVRGSPLVQFRQISQSQSRQRTFKPLSASKSILGAFVCTGLCVSGYMYMNCTSTLVADVYADQSNGVMAAERTLGGLHLALYQYEACPFCTKVRTFLDFEKLPYDVIEVNPVMRKELKFSTEYRKVPILVITDTRAGSHDNSPTQVQLNDSAVIISVLKTYLIQGEKKAIEDILKFYPRMSYKTERGKEKFEFNNRHNIMLEHSLSEEEQRIVREEVRWRKWTDDVLVHTLPPNIYRTPTEALQAFHYLTKISNFGETEKIIGKYVGAVAMYLVSMWLKRKYKLKPDVRESLYDAADDWCEALKKRKFMGGESPNLADLSVYGVLSSIEGLDTFHDLMVRTTIKQWYYRTKHAVGVNERRYDVNRDEIWNITA